MSWKVQATVGERVCGSITRKMILLNMASRANDDGSGVYASVPMVAGWCEVDARTVRRTVRDLEGAGLISLVGEKKVKNGFINEWSLNLEAIEALPLYRDEVAARREAKAQKTPDTVSGVQRAQRLQAQKTATPDTAPAGQKARTGAKSGRTPRHLTPDTAPASSILEPSSSLFAIAQREPAPVGAGDGSKAVAMYCEAAKRNNWVVAKVVNKSRQQAVRLRLRECGGLTGWAEQIALAESQPFLGGANQRGWRMNLDFFCSPSGWAKISEETYNGQGTDASFRTNARSASQPSAGASERNAFNPVAYGIELTRELRARERSADVEAGEERDIRRLA